MTRSTPQAGWWGMASGWPERPFKRPVTVLRVRNERSWAHPFVPILFQVGRMCIYHIIAGSRIHAAVGGSRIADLASDRPWSVCDATRDASRLLCVVDSTLQGVAGQTQR